MGLIKEPLDVDFVVDPRPLTKAEKKAISDFIKVDKEKRLSKSKRTEKVSWKEVLLAITKYSCWRYLNINTYID